MAADGDCHHLCKLMAPVRHRWSINDVIGGIRNTHNYVDIRVGGLEASRGHVHMPGRAVGRVQRADEVKSLAEEQTGRKREVETYGPEQFKKNHATKKYGSKSRKCASAWKSCGKRRKIQRTVEVEPLAEEQTRRKRELETYGPEQFNIYYKKSLRGRSAKDFDFHKQ
ncbi:hypothetical protein ANN_01795 [Periplaneta americana]|uniref:Uncharacterized protein n=1 Tax=Periplaneta americana TaxID=6978 RepID=A0ABQ8TUK5_PERAM|nr:hypothetical protein ANN_01795 [Periplaneta americana]